MKTKKHLFPARTTAEALHPPKKSNIIPFAMITAAILPFVAPRTAEAQRALGVDVSSYQGSVNCSSVKGAGISFAWAKATEGNYLVDGDFAGNENNGKAAGVSMGAYHFSRPDLNSAGTEAGYFWGTAGGYVKGDGKSLMPMLDVETFNGHVGASSYSAWVNQWCNDIKGDASGLTVQPVVYFSACACTLDSSVSQWISWIANYNGENAQTGGPWNVCSSCNPWGGSNWSLWQYSSAGSVSGISGSVDMDVFNGTSSQMLSTLLIGAGSEDFGDFYGTGRTDYVLWIPSTGYWNVRNSEGSGQVNSFAFGQAGDIPLIGNWSTPTSAEAAVFRPSTGEWYVRFEDGTSASFSWGANGDIPLIGAWSGQMRDEVVFRPSNGAWYIRFGNPGGGSATVYWGGGAGNTSDIPLVANFGGNGMIDQTIWRPSTGEWFVRDGKLGTAMGSFYWGGGAGNTSDIPMIGAWSGRMRDATIFRPSTGTWYIRFGDTGQTTSLQLGQAGDVPMIGNIFGNGMVDQIVFRPSTGMWYVRDGSPHGGTVYSFAWGGTGCVLVHE